MLRFDDPMGMLLAADDPQPFQLIESDPPGFPALLVCDHASAAVPASLGDLGLSPAAQATHIMWDIGAANVTASLSRRLSLPAVLAGYSRLVIDCNRRLDDPTAIAPTSDGATVPGNQRLTAEDRQRRADAVYWPYHHAIRDRLRQLEMSAPAPALISIHTFTPVFSGTRRPWHVGILWDKDSRLPEPLLAGLRAHRALIVGDNEPYSGRHPSDFTVDHHAEAEGLPHVSIEIRQDLVGHVAGADHWAALLADVLSPILARRELYRHRAGG